MFLIVLASIDFYSLDCPWSPMLLPPPAAILAAIMEEPTVAFWCYPNPTELPDLFSLIKSSSIPGLIPAREDDFLCIDTVDGWWIVDPFRVEVNGPS